MEQPTASQVILTNAAFFLQEENEKLREENSMLKAKFNELKKIVNETEDYFCMPRAEVSE